MNYREYKRMALSRDADPATVERGVLAIRSEMIDTLTQLEDRLSPRRVFDQIMQRGRTAGHGSSQFVSNLSDVVRDNPVSVVLFVGGVASLLNAERRVSRPRPALTEGEEREEGLRERAEGIKERAAGFKDRTQRGIGERAQEMRQRARDASQRAQAKRTELQGRARDTFTSARELSRKSFSDARSRGERMIHEEPLLLAGIGLAIGAIAGARVQLSERERRVFESAREDVPRRDRPSYVDTAAERAAAEIERGEVRGASRDIEVEERRIELIEPVQGAMPPDPNPGPPSTGGRDL